MTPEPTDPLRSVAAVATGQASHLPPQQHRAPQYRQVTDAARAVLMNGKARLLTSPATGHLQRVGRQLDLYGLTL
ncbi:hypothetical protein D9M68_949850 [compost metagenome]